MDSQRVSKEKLSNSTPNCGHWLFRDIGRVDLAVASNNNWTRLMQAARYSYVQLTSKLYDGAKIKCFMDKN